MLTRCSFNIILHCDVGDVNDVSRLLDKTKVCLFVWSLSSHSRMFHSYEDVTFVDKVLQILTYARH